MEPRPGGNHFPNSKFLFRLPSANFAPPAQVAPRLRASMESGGECSVRQAGPPAGFPRQEIPNEPSLRSTHRKGNHLHPSPDEAVPAANCTGIVLNANTTGILAT